jgi:signal transduction histidine kinase
LREIDRQLIDRCLRKEPGAWNDFVDRFLGLVYHVVQHTADMRSYPLTPEDKEDIAAQILLKIVENDYAPLRQFRGKSSLATYLTVIARRICVHELTRRVTARDTAAAAAARRAPLWGAGLALAAGTAGALLLLLSARRAERDFTTVARGAAAIAAGDLERRIEVEGGGEVRELAETLNAMSARLREMIAREAESKQFDSFMRISAMISHDLKNAIAGLSMLVSNMERQFHREEFRADAIESLREAAEKLKRTAARLSEPIKSLSGEYRREARPTDLVPLIRRVLAARAEPARPLYDIEARLPPTLVATVEPERVEAVVENLVVNALEAMGSKGGRLTVEAHAEGDYVHLSVADTGVGMTEDFIRTRLFRPFATTKSKGIGLGLFTCKEVVEAHGGRLEVESRPGAGTRFNVVLPSDLFKSGDRQRRSSRGTD